MKIFLAMLTTLLLVACSDNSNDAPATESGANNPLADEQELIRQAEGMQQLLNEDAEEKKKQLEQQ